MNLLIVEDEKSLANEMAAFLKKENYICDTAYTGKDASEKIAVNLYDFVLLDIGLPDYNGLDLIREARRQGSEAAFIILTARGSVEDKVKGLDLGADDYLSKPFALIELHSRIQAVARRKFAVKNPMVSIGEFIIDISPRKITSNNEVVDLTKKEFDLLLYLVAELGPGNLGERREDVDVGAQCVALRSSRDAAGGPAEEGHRSRAALIGRAFGALHAAIEDLRARGAAVVTGDVNYERVVFYAPFLKLLEQRTEVRIDVLDHAKELRCVFVDIGLAEILLVILLRNHVWTVRGVGRNVGEERLSGGAADVYPLDGLCEEQIGAIARRFLELPVVPERGIDVCVARRVAARAWVGLADTAAAVDIDFVEAAALRPVSCLVAEVPLAEDARRVADGFEHLREGVRFQAHPLSFEDGVRDTILELVPPAHQRRTAGRARRTDMEVRQEKALVFESIH